MLNPFVPVTLPLRRLQVQNSGLAKEVRAVGRQQETRKPTGPGFSDLDTFRDYCIKIQEGGQAVVSG